MIAYFNKIYTKGSEAFEKELDRYVRNSEKHFIVTANPETLMIGKSDSGLDKILRRKDVTIVPDGIGVVKAGRMLGRLIESRVTGVEIARTLFALADKYGRSVYLFGAKKEVLDKLVEKIQKEYPRAVIIGCRDGYVRNRDEVFEDIVKTQPDIVLIALGIPYQELLIGKYFDRFQKGIFVGVGGSFDVLSGTKKRAPEIFIRLNLEWLYRITTEPKRLGRFCRSNIKFLFEIISVKKSGGIRTND